MKRALILILSLTVLTFGCGWWLDTLERDTAMRYVEGLYQVRESVLADQMDDALRDQAYLHAMWQHDSHWLNSLIDHHHTRDVNGALQRLTTALEEKHRLASLLTLDEAIDALEEVAQRDLAIWENIL